jgi:endonuclease YncB( thermonuclease family)
MARVFSFLFLGGTLACFTPALAFQCETATATANAQFCRVAEILDGDTFSAYCDGVPTRIRVSSIDAPERRQSYGADAWTEASRLLGDQASVALHAVEHDRYGRLVARVTLADGRDLAREMVRAGLAWHYVRYSRDPELAGFETEAREARRGLWAAEDPEPPAMYRKRSLAAKVAEQRIRGYARRSEPRSQRRSLPR